MDQQIHIIAILGGQYGEILSSRVAVLARLKEGTIQNPIIRDNTIIGDLYSCVSQSYFAMLSCIVGNLTLRISTGVRSILATSRATLPWPSTTALSALRSGFNYRESNTYMCTCTFSSRIILCNTTVSDHCIAKEFHWEKKKNVTKIGYMYITENIGGNKLSPMQ